MSLAWWILYRMKSTVEYNAASFLYPATVIARKQSFGLTLVTLFCGLTPLKKACSARNILRETKAQNECQYLFWTLALSDLRTWYPYHSLHTSDCLHDMRQREACLQHRGMPLYMTVPKQCKHHQKPAVFYHFYRYRWLLWSLRYLTSIYLLHITHMHPFTHTDLDFRSIFSVFLQFSAFGAQPVCI